MARTKTLLDLIKGLRAELRHEISPNLGINTEERFRILLNSVQEELFDDYDWDHLKAYRYVAARAGQRYYDFPSDMDELSTLTFEYKWNQVYFKLNRGINSTMFAQRDSDKDERSDPMLAYQLYLDDATDTSMFEVWPIPSVTGTIYQADPNPYPVAQTPQAIKDPDGDSFIRIRGIKKPVQMIEDSDRCILDARLIILYAAASEATAQGSKDAATLSSRASQRLRSLRKNLKKTDPFIMGTDMHLKNPQNRRIQTANDIRFLYAPNN